MDKATEEQIRRFLGDGSGSGSGSGDGSGSGYGDGYGSGDGSGSGSGSGYGSGDGSGDGSGSGYGSGDGSGSGSGSGSGDGYGSGYGDGDGDIKEYCGHTVWMVDKTSTLIYSVHGNYAKGAILRGDLTLQPCYIARVGNSFAHGDTLREARRDAEGKDMRARPVEERVASFVAAHPDPNAECDGRDLYDWHHILTGSCRAGRDAWCRDHGLSPDSDRMTVREFLRLTANSYGGEVIRQVSKAYGSKL